MAWIKQFTPLLELWSQETAENIIPPVFYHQKCLLLFMSKEQSTVPSISEAENGGTASSALDYKTNYQYNEADECCLFCGKRRKGKRNWRGSEEHLSACRSMHAVEKIRGTAEIIGDKRILVIVNNPTLVLSKLKYHDSCRKNYILNMKKKSTRAEKG